MIRNKSSEHLNYDVLCYEDETFVAIKYRGVYAWIPQKIVSAHGKENKVLIVYKKIWDDIYDKAQKNAALNNLCELYF